MCVFQIHCDNKEMQIKGYKRRKETKTKRKTQKNKTNAKQPTCDFNIQESVFKD